MLFAMCLNKQDLFKKKNMGKNVRQLTNFSCYQPMLINKHMNNIFPEYN